MIAEDRLPQQSPQYQDKKTPHRSVQEDDGAGGIGKTPLLYLASRSPRRRELLADAGIHASTLDTGVDDGLLHPGDVTIEEWTIALAYFKARAGVLRLEMYNTAPGLVLGADTVVEYQGQIIGQPRDAAHAREIIGLLAQADHDVLTGIAIVDSETGDRTFLCDRANVTVGRISDAMVDEYIESGDWRGKAGAYNLADRIAEGWPITFEGDPGTIMGLPMRRLTEHLAHRWGVGDCQPPESASDCAFDLNDEGPSQDPAS